jgi:hypothetical protein
MSMPHSTLASLAALPTYGNTATFEDILDHYFVNHPDKLFGKP